MISRIWKVGLAALAVLATAGGTAPNQRAMPVHVGGRVIEEADGSLKFGWPAVYFEARFRGTGVRMKLDAPAEHMRLLVDGRERMGLKRPRLADIPVTGLPPGEHIVRLEKQTESQTGGGRLIGFYPIGGTVPLSPPRRSRQIEFIGDSYTVGYGNRAPTQTCTPDQVHDLTDSQQAFGPIVARRFDADYRVIAYSGFGMVRNYNGGNPDRSLPAIYPRLTPDQPKMADAPASGWRPQLIVINLGTNDFSTPLNRGERWADRAALRTDYRRRYVAFVRELIAAQPQARFILMGSELFFVEVEKVAAELEADAARRVIALRFDGLDYSGCHHHPSIADDRKLAALLAQAIGAMPGVWARGGAGAGNGRGLLDSGAREP